MARRGLSLIFQGVTVLVAALMASTMVRYVETAFATVILKSSLAIMPPITQPDGGAAYAAQCVAGALAAREFVKQMLANASPYDLGWRVQEIAKSGRFGGFEVGFFDEIAHLACGSPMLVAEENAEHLDLGTNVVDPVNNGVGRCREESAGSREDA